jgi:hypothetical protein
MARPVSPRMHLGMTVYVIWKLRGGVRARVRKLAFLSLLKYCIRFGDFLFVLAYLLIV